MDFIISKSGSINGVIYDIPGDKSISHRVITFALFCSGISKVKGLLGAYDIQASMEIAKGLGLQVTHRENELLLESSFFKQSFRYEMGFDCGNSGTTLRLYLGLLSAVVKNTCKLYGDESLSLRPNKRLLDILRNMGAKVSAVSDTFCPIRIFEGEGCIIDEISSEVPSAQIKSAVILRAMLTDGITFSEPSKSRDHTENMLKALNAPIDVSDKAIKVSRLKTPLEPFNISVPKDPSSAFYFVLLATLMPDSKITLKSILLNPTRNYAYEILKNMGAKITFNNEQFLPSIGEWVCDIHVESASLRAITISENIPWLIDEIPALAIAFAFADGESEIRGARELRIKESDRIRVTKLNLAKLGVEVLEFEDGLKIKGGLRVEDKFKDLQFDSYGDHRIAMSYCVLSAIFGARVANVDCIKTSFLEFGEILGRLTQLKEVSSGD